MLICLLLTDLTDQHSAFDFLLKNFLLFGLFIRNPPSILKVMGYYGQWEFSDSPESKLELTQFGLDLLKYGISKKNETNVYLNKS